MCSKEKTCAEYLRSKPELERCIRQLKKKWLSFGKVTGNIVLKNASEQERQAVGGVLGKRFYEKDIRFSCFDFEHALQKSCYGPVEIKGVLEEYFQETLLTNQEKTVRKEEKKHRFLMAVREYMAEISDEKSIVYSWSLKLESDRVYGYQLLMKEYYNDPEQALLLMQQVGRGWTVLERYQKSGEMYPLAVFAAEVTGNPHFFDRNTVAGQLLMHLICYASGADLPENAHQWRERLEAVCIVSDNLSSMIHAYGLHLRTGKQWHPAYEAFCQLKQPCVVTMENLQGITGASTEHNRAYIVENEMVFSYLISQMEEEEVTLLCTSGQPRTAALKLISLLLAEGTELFYSGDIDPDGVRIAERLWKKFDGRIHLWRMEASDYKACLSKETFGPIGNSKLDGLEHPQLKITAKVMKNKGLCGYQENILQDLLTDIKQSDKVK